MTDGQPPIHAETYEPRWVCPACGSDNIQGLAWVRLNGEGVESWIEGEDYWYYRTLPLKGYGAVMARYIRRLQAEGHKPLLARFQMRIYIYATGVTPIGAGKPPGA